MKYFYYILIFVGFFATSCSTNKIVLTEDQLSEDVFFLENEIKPFTGKCVIYYTDSKVVKEEMHFTDGILNGTHTSYYKNGQLKREGKFLNGNLEGTWVGYSENGTKLYEAHYSNDTLAGAFVSWYETGVPKEKGEYKDNRRIGNWTYYDEAGMILRK